MRTLVLPPLPVRRTEADQSSRTVPMESVAFALDCLIEILFAGPMFGYKDISSQGFSCTFGADSGVALG